MNETWLYNGDLSIYQLGWNFFKNDIWRFPLGLNPNYGIYYGGSIVFSDSIPILAFIFKIFKGLLPESFQYFSIWILICIYLQIYLANKIIFHYTKNFSFSFISSFFFLIATIFVHRSGIHLSLMGHWLILLYFWINISEEEKYKNLKKQSLIVFSSLIHFYFTIILIIIYIFQLVFNFKNNLKSYSNFLITNSLFLIFLIFVMYVTGYFSININDGLGGGYGYFNYNLNSFFNPFGFNNVSNFSWSSFFPILNTTNNNAESISYLGLSGIIFFVIYFLNVYKKNFLVIFDRNLNISICIFLLLIAASNNISFGNYHILNIELNKYFYLILSSVRASGRLIWPVFYLITFFGIIYIYQSNTNRNAKIIISFLLIIQLIDLMPGILNYKLGKQFVDRSDQYVKSVHWRDLSKKFDEIRLIEPKNQSELFYNLAKHLISEKYKKSDVAYLARSDRLSIEKTRYDLIRKYNLKDLDIFDKSIFITKKISLVRNLKILYGDDLNYYFLDKIWILSSKKINNLENINFVNLPLEYYKLGEKGSDYLEFKNDKIHPFRLGWEYDNNQKKFVSLGYNSSMIFEMDENICKQNLNLRFYLEKYFKNYNELNNMSVFVNNTLFKKVKVNDIFDFNLQIPKDCFNNEYIKIDFYYDNPISKFDNRIGLNRKKRAIIFNQIKID